MLDTVSKSTEDVKEIIAHDLESDLTMLERWIVQRQAEEMEIAAVIKRVISSARCMNGQLIGAGCIKDNSKQIGAAKSGASQTQATELESRRLCKSAILNQLSNNVIFPKAGDGRSWIGIASPSVMCVDEVFLLHTSYGDWLKKKQLIGWAILFWVFMLGILIFLTEIAGSDVTLYDGSTEMKTSRTGAALFLLPLTSGLLAWFHLGHCVNRQLFVLALRSFRGLVLVGSQMMSSCIWIYELYTTYYTKELFDVEWQIVVILATLFIEVPAVMFLATIDSVQLRRACTKTTAVATTLVFYIGWYLNHRFFSERWSDKQIVIFSVGIGTARNLYCVMMGQIVLFLSDIFYTQLQGYKACVIRPVYTPLKIGSEIVPVTAWDTVDTRCFPGAADSQPTRVLSAATDCGDERCDEKTNHCD